MSGFEVILPSITSSEGCCVAMDMDAAFSTEMQRLEAAPATPTERAAAQRALARYEKSGGIDGDSQVSTSEDWVLLSIALRRVRPQSTRITPSLLKQWRTKVTSSATVKRKCFLVDTAALDALPQYPTDLDKWIIPKEQLVLPADIYTDGMLIIDDGHDRSKLNVPRVLHLELAAKWTQQRPTQPWSGAGSGSNDSFCLDHEGGASFPVAPAASDPVPLPPIAPPRPENTAKDPFLEHHTPEHAMQEIIANAIEGSPCGAVDER